MSYSQILKCRDLLGKNKNLFNTQQFSNTVDQIDLFLQQIYLIYLFEND